MTFPSICVHLPGGLVFKCFFLFCVLELDRGGGETLARKEKGQAVGKESACPFVVCVYLFLTCTDDCDQK